MSDGILHSEQIASKLYAVDVAPSFRSMESRELSDNLAKFVYKIFGAHFD